MSTDDRQLDAGASDTSDVADDRVTLEVFRYQPDDGDDVKPYYETFEVPYEEGMTVLDALLHARDHSDGTLTFRHSCRQGICGSDAMFVNGSQRLCCTTQVSELDQPIQIDPLPHQDVIKDLVVDMDHFYDQMHAVDPFFDPDELPAGELEEQLQSPENRETIKKATRCIWCGACTSSCNIAAGDNQYLGPAALTKAYRFIKDEREGDERQSTRLEQMSDDHAVWRCQTQFSCTEVCPKDIPNTEHIQELKRLATKHDLSLF